MKDRLRLPDDLRDEWRKATEPIRFSELDPEGHCHMARELARKYLSCNIRAALEDFRRPGGLSYLVMANLPVDANLSGPTPCDGRCPGWKLTWTAEFALLGILAEAGFQVFALMEEYGGDLIQNLAPSPVSRDKPTGTGQKKLLWHVDNAIMPRDVRPEGLILLGLKSSERVETCVAPLDDIIAKLDPRHVEVLSQPLYTTKTPPSFHLNDQTAQVCSRPRPVIYRGPDGEWEVQWSFMEGEIALNHAEARPAIQALQDALADGVADPVEVVSGSALLVNNMRAMHSRSPVHGERWVLRAYGRRSLAHLEAAGRTGLPHRYSAPKLMS